MSDLRHAITDAIEEQLHQLDIWEIAIVYVYAVTGQTPSDDDVKWTIENFREKL